MESAQIHRKLQPVYGALDAHDYKTAIKLCERKDLLNSPLAQALRAYAIERKATTSLAKQEDYEAQQQKLQEALDIVHQVSQSAGANDGLVRTLMLVLRNLGQWEEITQLYERGFEASTDLVEKREFGEKLFFHLLRTNELEKMAKHGMALSKVFQDEACMTWTAAIFTAHATLMAWQREQQSGDQQHMQDAKKKLLLAGMMLKKALATFPVVSSEQESTSAETDSSSKEEKGMLGENVRMLLTRVLLLDGKDDEALQVAERELGHLQNRERLLLLAELNQVRGMRSGNVESIQKAADLFYTLLLEEDHEDWRNWAGYIENAMDIEQERAAVLAKVQVVAEKAKEANGGKHTRGPSLAVVMFHYCVMLGQLSEGPASEDVLISFAEAVTDYLKKFDSKACCFGDLRNFLLAFVVDASEGVMLPSAPSLPRKPPSPQFVYTHGTDLGKSPFQAQMETKYSRRWPVETFSCLIPAGTPARKSLVAFLEARLSDCLKELSDEANEKHIRVKALRSYITCCQILKYIGEWEALNRDVVLDKVQGFVKVYLDTQILDEGAQGGQREVKVGDDLALLASHVLVDLCNREDGKESSPSGRFFLLLAVGVLRRAYEHSPTGFQLALQLMELYGRLDMLMPSCELYNSLDIKHIQIDSLSYIVLGDFIRAGGIAEASQACTNVEEFWRGSRGDVVEYSKRAFHLGNLLNGVEFIRLDQLLFYSHQRSVALAEAFTFTCLRNHLASWEAAKAFLLQANTPHASNEPFQLSRLGDIRSIDLEKHLSSNYDFTVRVSWDCVLGTSAVAETKKLDEDPFPCIPQARACTAHKTYDTKWHAKALAWLQFRLLIADTFQMTLENAPKSNQQELLSGLDSFAERLSLDRSTPLVQVGFLSLEASLKLVGKDIGNAAQIKPVVDCFTALVSQLDQLKDMLETNNLINTLRVASHAMTNSLFWASMLCRAWMDISPRKRNKKKKSNPSPEEVSTDEFQNALKAVSTSLLAVFDALEAKFATTKTTCADPATVESESLRLSSEFQHSSLIETTAFSTLVERFLESRVERMDKLSESLNELRAIVKSAKY